VDTPEESYGALKNYVQEKAERFQVDMTAVDVGVVVMVITQEESINMLSNINDKEMITKMLMQGKVIINREE